MKEFYIQSSDKKSNLHVCVWEPKCEVKAILQICHGMAEHIERYEGFAHYLNEKGILVAGNDHIGHGLSSNENDWGYFGKAGGYLRFIDDIELVKKELDNRYTGIPHYLLGHSMGSFIARSYLAKYGNVDKAIIMGTAGNNPATGIGAALVSLLRKTKGDRYKSKLITNMAFGSYNNKIKDPISSNAWLSRDIEVVKKYDEDKACGFTFTLAAYADLFNLLKYMNSDECYNNIPQDIPVFIVAGEADPVGSYGQGPKEVYDKLLKRRIHNTNSVTKLKLYKDMLHEILNEYGKEEVYEDCYNFLVE